ncbi:glycogen debranching protein GlgX [Testudinibacter sp. TR-2022]|uniref:glycogen debranching protein GlgX n=1 Tax=Testudinibacter sp. TR-2022 TaxID=2585029 RepID=UPI001117F63A|nr:glycogen debranching protein GlgX [Pasteurellaceae bacterium Phil11]TNH25071.1 glycogen debranching protein GlgX [Testudinibacter sp. TR-2022]TNH29383.1 glycogen debranching protein GlgX [Testudinibacter sp. TR-2022]
MIGRVRNGMTQPLGASIQVIEGQYGVNFAVFSEHAAMIELCLFSYRGKEHRFKMIKGQDHIWSLWLAGVETGIKYGFRAYGEDKPQQGISFNPQKVMLDPYAKAVDSKPCYQTDKQLMLFDFANELDNHEVAPKAVVIADDFDWQGDQSPDYPWAQTIIYELHVKGFSQLNPNIPPELRGSYAGLAHPASVNYLKKLGVTALELMPVAFHADELHLQRRGLSNYWGYNLLAPFAVDNRYWSGRKGTTPESEFKQMVKTLHQAGFEVILDVVFNHTADSDWWQPTLSQRGLDNANYYWLTENGEYHNWSGCGNALNLTKPNTLQWVHDCLRYWVDTFHVDGFRFDLATIIGREPEFNRYAAIFERIANDPVLKDKKYIAEPWDIGWGGYQLGNFPDYFAEWNDRFRDDIRRFWLHNQGNMGLFAQRFSASADIFQHEQKRPSASINYICSHDGFTLHDLVSYQQKHNWANGEENRDGHGESYNNNFGIEGETEQTDILQQRQAAKRALLATALLANGTPMLLAGDEFGHSQQGNNNAYCQDNEITWIDWSQQDQQLLAYSRAIIQIRKQITALCGHNDWWNDSDVQWLNQAGQAMSIADWEDGSSVGFQIQLDDKWLFIINRSAQQQDFNLPQGTWHHAISQQTMTVEGNNLKVSTVGLYILYR